MTHAPGKTDTYEQLTIDSKLNLSAVTEAEADMLYSLVDSNRQYLAQYLPWARGNTREDSLHFIKKTAENRQNGSEYAFGIYNDGALAGHISLMYTSNGKSPEIGYWISRDYSGSGITTRCADRVTDFGLHTLGLKFILIKAAVDNVASNKIAEKIGYQMVGTEQSDNDTTINIWRITNE